MGKKRVAVIGDIFEEEESRQKRAVQREQKAIRKGKKITPEEQIKIDKNKKLQGLDKGTKIPGMKGGERVVDGADESMAELERLKAKEKELETLTTNEKKENSELAKKRKTKTRSNRYVLAKSKIKINKKYSIVDAVAKIRELNLTKFPATIEVHINLIKKDAFTGQIIELPYGSGSSKKVVVVNDKLLKDLDAKKIDFDVLLARKEDMPKLIKYAKLLGPKGLMPNPKTGTIVDDPKKVISKFTSDNRLEIKVERKAPLIHTVAGKLSMKDEQLIANLNLIIDTVGKKNIQKIYLSSTMSPSLRLEI